LSDNFCEFCFLSASKERNAIDWDVSIKEGIYQDKQLI